MDDSRILVIQSGGTIDKDYPKRRGGYAFEICDSAAERVLKQLCSDSAGYDFQTVCRKDSLDMKDSDRLAISKACNEYTNQRILITHGTDTMIQMAEYLAQTNTDKIIVITGSFLPETFKHSDAVFNLGFALGALQTMTSVGVYLAMNVTIIPVEDASRDDKSGHFIKRSKRQSTQTPDDY